MSTSDLKKLSRDAKKLIALVKEQYLAPSYLEKVHFRKRLTDTICAISLDKFDDVINQAYDFLENEEDEAAGLLSAVLDSCCESMTITYQKKEYDVLLVAIPIHVWTNYQIYHGKIPKSLMQSIKSKFQDIWLAEHTQFAIKPFLLPCFSLLPTYAAVKAFTEQAADEILKGKVHQYVPNQKNVPPLNVDVRFLLATLVAPKGEVFFKWQQEKNPTRLNAVKTEHFCFWATEMDPLVKELLPACRFNLLHPGAFFETYRRARRTLGPKRIISLVNYLETMCKIRRTDIGAIVGGFSSVADSDVVEEYRISFYKKSNNKLLYGLFWSCDGQEMLKGGFKAADMLEYFRKNKNHITELREILETLGHLHIDLGEHFVERFVLEPNEQDELDLFVNVQGELETIDEMEVEEPVKILH